MSLQRAIKRGHIRPIFNETLNRLEFFRRTKKSGLWIKNSGFGNRDLSQGPGFTTAQLDSWAKN